MRTHTHVAPTGHVPCVSVEKPETGRKRADKQETRTYSSSSAFTYTEKSRARSEGTLQVAPPNKSTKKKTLVLLYGRTQRHLRAATPRTPTRLLLICILVLFTHERYTRSACDFSELVHYVCDSGTISYFSPIVLTLRYVLVACLFLHFFADLL